MLEPELVEKTSKSVYRKIIENSEVIFKEIKFEEQLPDYTEPIMDVMTEWFRNLAFPISSIYTFIHSSVITLALFDQYLGEILKI